MLVGVPTGRNTWSVFGVGFMACVEFFNLWTALPSGRLF